MMNHHFLLEQQSKQRVQLHQAVRALLQLMRELVHGQLFDKHLGVGIELETRHRRADSREERAAAVARADRARRRRAQMQRTDFLLLKAEIYGRLAVRYISTLQVAAFVGLQERARSGRDPQR